MSEIGTIADFIKAFPMYTIEDYKWHLNPRMIRLMCADNTHIHYLSERQVEQRKARIVDTSNMSELSDLGIPIFGLKDSINE